LRWFWQTRKPLRPCEPRRRDADCSAWTKEDRLEFLANARAVNWRRVSEELREEYALWLRQKWEEISLPVRNAKLVIDFPLEETPDIEVEYFLTPQHKSWTQLRRPNGEYVKSEDGVIRASRASDAYFVWHRLMARLYNEPDPDPEQGWEGLLNAWDPTAYENC
jgi:hypothetical protein